MRRYLPIFLTLFCMLLLPVTSRGDDTEQAMTEVSITTFGGKPDTHTNLRMIMARALNYCKTHPGTRLTFPKGRYDFAPASEGDYVIGAGSTTASVMVLIAASSFRTSASYRWASMTFSTWAFCAI